MMTDTYDLFCSLKSMPGADTRRTTRRLGLRPHAITGQDHPDRVLTDLTVEAFEGFRRERLLCDRATTPSGRAYHRALARIRMTELRTMLRLLSELDGRRFGRWLGCDTYPCTAHDMLANERGY